MKKFLALLMTITLVFSLSACKKSKAPNSSGVTGDVNPTDTNVSDFISDFEKPDDYAAVLSMSVNPQFKLYLDNKGNTLAIDFVNDDAKSLETKIEYKDTDFQKVIKTIITVSNDSEYIKNQAKIDFEITELKNPDTDQRDILKKASASAKATASELKITVEITITEFKTEADDNAAEQKPSTDNNKQPTTPTTNHTHSFSSATCTEAAKCSCGTTDGNPLGHTWQSATCKAPKTCKVCGATEGNKTEHDIQNGVCSVCGESMLANPKTDLDTNENYYIGNFRLSGDTLLGSGLTFYPNDNIVVVGTHEYTTEQGGSEVVFNGVKYYHQGEGFMPNDCELTDTEIIIKENGSATIKLNLLKNGILVVTYSKNSNYPVGTKLSLNWKDVV